MRPAIHLALSRLAWSDGRYTDALRFANDYAGTGDIAIAALERARALAALERLDDAAVAYEEGLAARSDGSRTAWREDLAWAAEPDELAQYDSLPTDSTGNWVSRFWRQRDALEMRAPGERLREHLRRWAYAHQKFPLLRPDDTPIHAEGQRDNDQWNVMQGNDPFLAIVLSSTALNSPGWKLYQRTQWEVDDRGVIYVRHGEPTKKASSPNGPPNESWLYQRSTDRPIFHFLGSHALGTTSATTLVASLPLSPEMLDARGALDPRYTALGDYIQGRRDMLKSWSQTPDAGKNPEFFAAIKELQAGRNPRSGKVLGEIGAAGSRGGSAPLFAPGLADRAAAEHERGQKTVITGVSTDGYPRSFDRQLNAVVQLHGMGFGPGDTRRILAVFAVDGGSLTPLPRPDGNGLYYPVALRLIALDRSGQAIRQLDTIRNFSTRDTLRPGQHLSGYLELPVPAGAYRVRLLVTTADQSAGAAGARDDIDLAASELSISDLVLGRPGSTLVWKQGDAAFPLNPLNAYPKGVDAELLYEASGLTPGVSYESTIAIRRAGERPDSRPAIEIITPFTPPSSYQAVRQTIGLKELKPGAWWMTVTLRQAGTDQTVVRRRALNLLDK